MRSRLLLTFPLLVTASWGCATPATYESAALPRFLVDPVTVTALTPDRHETPPVPVADPPVVTLPDAISECVLNNLRLKVGVEKIRLSQADYITESLIPNCQIMVDAQLLPVSTINFDNQAGPPQYDAMLTVPIDWFLFGKRVAAQAAAQSNIDVAQAEYADLFRREIAMTIDTFYDALEADAGVTLAQQDLESLQALEKTAMEHAKGDDKSGIEGRRVKLAILDAQRDLRKRRALAATTKAKLQVRIGRPPDTPDFVVRGTLSVRAAVPVPTIEQAWALAEHHRPDLITARRAIVAADAVFVREQRRAYPQVSITSGANYMDQSAITGFRNAWLWTVALNTTLPFTDRNQGRLLSAEASARSARAALGVATSDARAEVEQALAEYTEAMNGISAEDVASLRTAKEVRDETLAAYRKGTKDLLDALDAERAYRDRLRNTLGNLTDYWQALNRLNTAISLRALTATDAAKDTLLNQEERPKVAIPPAK